MNTDLSLNSFELLTVDSEDSEQKEEPVFDDQFMAEFMATITNYEQDLEEVLGSFTTENIDPNPLGSLGDLISDDFLDAMGDLFDVGGPKQDFRPKQETDSDFQLDPLPEREPLLECVDMGLARMLIWSSCGVVYVGDDKMQAEVGWCLSDATFKFELTRDDHLTRAEKLSEIGGIKGTGLAFSNLIHSAAIVALSAPDSVIEPVEGMDLIRDGVTFEVTGKNYKKRDTHAKVVVSKYLLLKQCQISSEKYEWFVNASRMEDEHKLGLFDESGIDQPDSEYSNLARSIHDALRQYPDEVYARLYDMAKTYMSKVEMSQRKYSDFKFDVATYDNCFAKYAKSKDGVSLLPTPFKVLSVKCDDYEKLRSIKVSPYEGLMSVGSTFHTRPVGYDPELELVAIHDHRPRFESLEMNKYMSFIYQQMLSYSIFNAAHVEAELHGKIFGKSGCYASAFSGVGISWRNSKANGNTYLVCYYQLTEPKDSCGRWLKDDALGCYKSPTFRLSVSDILYSKILPMRMAAMYYSTLAYTNKSIRRYLMQQMMLLMAMLRGSSWQTSALIGDSRFMVLCAVSGSGDVASMLDKAPKRVSQYLTFTDYYTLFKLRKFGLTYNGGTMKRTPLFDLPMRFIAIEKDIPLMQMWHIRKADHATKCFIKLRDGVRLELQSRQSYLKHLELQLDFIERIKDGVTQGDFDFLMDFSPNTPYYNHLFTSALVWKGIQGIDAGKRTTPTKLSIRALFSDHNCTTVTYDKVTKLYDIRSSRVADAMRDLLREYGDPVSIYSLMYNIAMGEKKRNIFATHPKDSKSKNREIPQMTSYMRVFQFASESLCEIYTDSDPSDMMQNPEKFSRFAVNFSKAMKSGGIARSEDKEFFCGWMQPEFMALVISTVAHLTGSTSLITAASIMRTDKSRFSVIPDDCNPDILGDLPREYVRVHKNNKVYMRPMILSRTHMGQGVKAMAAAVVNTVTSVGAQKMFDEMCSHIKESDVITTSDDAARYVVMHEASKPHAQSS